MRAHLLAQDPEPELAIAVIDEAMSNFYRYFFVMPTLARLELELHDRVERGEAVTAGTLIEVMADLWAEGFGDEVVGDRERTGIAWADLPAPDGELLRLPVHDRDRRAPARSPSACWAASRARPTTCWRSCGRATTATRSTCCGPPASTSPRPSRSTAPSR